MNRIRGQIRGQIRIRGHSTFSEDSDSSDSDSGTFYFFGDRGFGFGFGFGDILLFRRLRDRNPPRERLGNHFERDRLRLRHQQRGSSRT